MQGYLPGQLYNLNSKYGNKEELKALLKAFKEAGIVTLADIVHQSPLRRRPGRERSLEHLQVCLCAPCQPCLSSFSTSEWPVDT